MQENKLALDIEDPHHLRRYLQARGLFDEERAFIVGPLTGGVSNKVMLVSGTRAGDLVIKQALEKLRVKDDWYSLPTRIHREALGLRWLQRLEPAGSTPSFLFEDHEHHLFAMEAIPEPHSNLKTVLLTKPVPFALISQMGELLANLHALSEDGNLRAAEVFADQSFFESLRLEPFYLRTAETEPAAAAFLQELVVSTRERKLGLTHGDFSPKNFLVRGGRLCLLDHEVIHFGDPAFDIGFLLTHLLSKAHHFPAKREDFAHSANLFFSSYRQNTDCTGECEKYAVRHGLGCLIARVAGRSPLEYLDVAEKARQSRAVLKLLPNPPATVEKLISAFLDEIS